MKTIKTGINIFIALLSILILVASCIKEENNLKPETEINSQTPEEKNIQFLKSALGGCNKNRAIEEIEDKADTVIINLTNDTLNIFAGIKLYLLCSFCYRL